MSKDLDAFINENAYCIPIRDEYGDTQYEATVIDVDDLRAWMAGKVLCDAEPAAYASADLVNGQCIGAMAYRDCRAGMVPLYKPTVPLYKPTVPIYKPATPGSSS